ncbi:hypothetical protein DM860_018069 [Cuscuta australis]|uniref:Poly [ADP-ribose] polymerase n=1 Tax=Cuscuta australis TaxID=267555 RepID=A0A328D1I2_9ASTE|nr:hypothetical protein DM860_018069 [Cuscuta australis]
MKSHAPPQAHPNAGEEGMVTRKHKAAEEKPEPPKKPRTDMGAVEFQKFCKATRDHLSVQQMRDILQVNGQDYSSCSEDDLVKRCQEIMFYGPLEKCPICGGALECGGDGAYHCKGDFSEWSACVYITKDPPRTKELLSIPESVKKTPTISDIIKKHEYHKGGPEKEVASIKPLSGMMISLSGRLTRTHQYWKSQIEKNGGQVANSVIGVSCLVVSPAERERGGSSKVAEAVERGIPVVREAWLVDSIEKREAQPLDAYDVMSDIAIEGRGIPLDKQDSSAEALETIAAQLKVYGKRGVHKDTKLQDEGGRILERDGLLYNCALALCDQGRQLNELCIMQLIVDPEKRLHMYYRRGRVGDIARVDDKLEERENEDEAVKEFAKIFEDLTGNEFESWEREKKIQKKSHKFFPLDVADGVEVRHGGLGLRQLGVAAAHSKLDPMVANLMKVLCSQEIYRYALMEMGHDYPEVPIGMLSDTHLKTCEDTLLHYVERLKAAKGSEHERDAVWAEFSNKWFTLMPSTRPFRLRDLEDIADHVASTFETIRDINVASRLIEDMSGSTIDDPLFDRYKKLGCSISPLEKDSDDYKMIVKYLGNTYEPVTVGDISYGVSVENIFSVEPSACPSLNDMKKLPNKVLLWCGTRSSNLLRHLQKGFLPSVCSLPVPGYMFGKAVVCSDAAAEAARYGFTAVDRPEGFLLLAVASMVDDIQEFSSPPEDTKRLEEKNIGAKCHGRKKTHESEHFVWRDGIKVPCGRLVESGHKDSPLSFNEYAVFDPQQVSIRFLVAVKYEEQDVEYDEAKAS